MVKEKESSYKSERKEIKEKIREYKEKESRGKSLNLPTTTYKEGVAKERVKHAGTYVKGIIHSIYTKKALTKPHAKIKHYPASKLMKEFASSGYSMFKSEPHNYQEQPVQDNRSLFFQETLNREKKLNRGWL